MTNSLLSRRVVLELLAAAALLPACSGKDLKPQEPKWDRQPCDRCRMILSDRLHAAQVIDPKTGKAYFFDDLGCAILWLEKDRPDLKGTAPVYLTDSKDGHWIDLKAAVLADGFVTPMAFGVAGFATEAALPSGKARVKAQDLPALFAERMAAKKRRMGKPQ